MLEKKMRLVKLMGIFYIILDILKKKKYSLERIWNKTQHIITTCLYYKTENGNFNMIFNDDKNIKEFITYFYHIMPTIQTYVIKITLKVLQKLGLINEIEFIINNSMTTNRYLMLSNKEKNRELKDLLNSTLLICPRCFKIYLDRFLFYNYHKENEEYIKGRYKSKKVK